MKKQNKKYKILLSTLIPVASLGFAGAGVAIGYTVFNKTNTNNGDKVIGDIISSDEFMQDIQTKFTNTTVPEKLFNVKGEQNGDNYNLVSSKEIQDFFASNLYSELTFFTGEREQGEAMSSWGNTISSLKGVKQDKWGTNIWITQVIRTHDIIETNAEGNNFCMDTIRYDVSFNTVYDEHTPLMQGYIDYVFGTTYVNSVFDNLSSTEVMEVMANVEYNEYTPKLSNSPYVIWVHNVEDSHFYLLGDSAPTISLSDIESKIQSDYLLKIPDTTNTKYFASQVIDMTQFYVIS